MALISKGCLLKVEIARASASLNEFLNPHLFSGLALESHQWVPWTHNSSINKHLNQKISLCAPAAANSSEDSFFIFCQKMLLLEKGAESCKTLSREDWKEQDKNHIWWEKPIFSYLLDAVTCVSPYCTTCSDRSKPKELLMNKSVKYSPPAQLPVQILLISQAFFEFPSKLVC